MARDQTPVPCIAGQIPIHWITRDILLELFSCILSPDTPPRKFHLPQPTWFMKTTMTNMDFSSLHTQKLNAERWGNCIISLTCFRLLRDHNPMMSLVQCLQTVVLYVCLVSSFFLTRRKLLWYYVMSRSKILLFIYHISIWYLLISCTIISLTHLLVFIKYFPPLCYIYWKKIKMFMYSWDFYLTWAYFLNSLLNLKCLFSKTF